MSCDPEEKKAMLKLLQKEAKEAQKMTKLDLAIIEAMTTVDNKHIVVRAENDLKKLVFQNQAEAMREQTEQRQAAQRSRTIEQIRAAVRAQPPPPPRRARQPRLTQASYAETAETYEDEEGEPGASSPSGLSPSMRSASLSSSSSAASSPAASAPREPAPRHSAPVAQIPLHLSPGAQTMHDNMTRLTVTYDDLQVEGKDPAPSCSICWDDFKRGQHTRIGPKCLRSHMLCETCATEQFNRYHQALAIPAGETRDRACPNWRELHLCPICKQSLLKA